MNFDLPKGERGDVFFYFLKNSHLPEIIGCVCFSIGREGGQIRTPRRGVISISDVVDPLMIAISIRRVMWWATLTSSAPGRHPPPGWPLRSSSDAILNRNHAPSTPTPLDWGSIFSQLKCRCVIWYAQPAAAGERCGGVRIQSSGATWYMSRRLAQIPRISHMSSDSDPHSQDRL